MGSFVEGERLYYLYGWIQFQRLEAELKHGDKDGDDTTGTQPGQGTPTEREMWQDPDRIDEIQYQ